MTMQVISVSKLKSDFSAVLKKVLAGEEIAVCYGRKKTVIAKIVPVIKREKRQIGILEGKGKVIFKDDFRISEEEFLGK